MLARGNSPVTGRKITFKTRSVAQTVQDTNPSGLWTDLNAGLNILLAGTGEQRSTYLSRIRDTLTEGTDKRPLAGHKGNIEILMMQMSIYRSNRVNGPCIIHNYFKC